MSSAKGKQHMFEPAFGEASLCCEMLRGINWSVKRQTRAFGYFWGNAKSTKEIINKERLKINI